MTNTDNNPRAIILIIVGITVLAFQDALIKFISQETNIFLIYFTRSIIAFLLLAIFLYLKKESIILKTYYPKLTILRCILFFLSFSLYYYSLSKLSLAKVTTLFFVSPFFVTIISIIILNEVIGIRRWCALLIGFIGVYLVMEPDFNNFDIYSTFPVICAFGYSLTMIIQKITSDKDNLYSQTFHLYLAAIIFSLIIFFILGDGKYYNPLEKDLIFLFIPWSINSYSTFAILIILGLISVLGFLCIFQAYRIGSPPSVAPLEYIIIVWALIFSWVIWGETLNLRGYIGLLFIVFAGLYTYLREIRKNIKVSIDKPKR
ncbi:MAG: Riboflavin transporter [Alphaproteobacteria bacterium MarineAlpha5_Bin9]|nr:MAG: Riboflavin transporter [Alphaproteobacteria bacterium MarineAlpha5_Bin9]|tara:strand:+ start:12175 stop:13125 length:951 start_codon:yes stop_codon:yes gene_type:complete